jgi:hypothetical protein
MNNTLTDVAVRPLKSWESRGLVSKVSVPEGVCGDWRIERFVVSEDDARRFNFGVMMDMLRGAGDRRIEAGAYTWLKRGSETVMSDTPAERYDHAGFVYVAKGRVLVNGLGLGMVIQALLDKPDVTNVTVVEKSSEVIELVASHYLARCNDRLTIEFGDAFLARPSKYDRFDYIWHDIWDTICSDNLPQMARLKRKWRGKCGFQACWCETEMRRAKLRGW